MKWLTILISPLIFAASSCEIDSTMVFVSNKNKSSSIYLTNENINQHETYIGSTYAQSPLVVHQTDITPPNSTLIHALYFIDDEDDSSHQTLTSAITLTGCRISDVKITGYADITAEYIRNPDGSLFTRYVL